MVCVVLVLIGVTLLCSYARSLAVTVPVIIDMYNSLLLTALLLKYLGKQFKNVVLPMAYSKLYRESGPNFVGARTIGCSIQSFFF